MPVSTGFSYAIRAWADDTPNRFYSRSGASLQQNDTPIVTFHLPGLHLRKRWSALPRTFFSSRRPLLLARRWFKNLLRGRKIAPKKRQFIHSENEALIADDDDDIDNRATNRTFVYTDPFLIPHHHRYPPLTPSQRQEFLEKKCLISREKVRRVLGEEAAEHISDVGDAWLSWLEYDREVRVLDFFEELETGDVVCRA